MRARVGVSWWVCVRGCVCGDVCEGMANAVSNSAVVVWFMSVR
eukprot:COSAG06_NODE_65851_length_256_cov_0.515924_1_plen_42_part_10